MPFIRSKRAPLDTLNTISGGAGGTSYVVSNLNDSGAGSLREAVEASGPRVVTFGVAGDITQESKLEITNDDITIDGADNAICLRKYGIKVDAANVIVRNLRIRPGPDSNGNDTDAVQFLDSANGCLLERCSLTWATDENLSVVGGSNILVRWCLIAEGLYASTHPDGNHSMGALFNKNINTPVNVVFYQNIICKNNSRNPQLVEGEIVLLNNVWISRNVFGLLRADTGETLTADVINNYFADTGQTTVKVPFDGASSLGTHNMYLSGNYSTEYGTTQSSFLSGTHTVALSQNNIPDMTIFPAESLREFLVGKVGARRPYLDAVDTRILNEVATDSTLLNALIDDPDDVGGYPTLT